MIGLLSW